MLTQYPTTDPEEVTSVGEEIGAGVRWPGIWLALAFVLMCLAAGWDRLLGLLRVKRKDTSPAARWQQPD